MGVAEWAKLDPATLQCLVYTPSFLWPSLRTPRKIVWDGVLSDSGGKDGLGSAVCSVLESPLPPRWA